jgi:hypothetical protein
MIDLYFWPTGNGKKVVILLEECGLPYTIKPINIGRGDQLTPDFLKISPNADSEFWELHVPIDASGGLRGTQINRVRDSLIEWIETDAARFPITRFGDRYGNPSLGERVADVPFPVSLHRCSFSGSDFPAGSPLAGRFSVKYVVSGNLEQARAARLQRACEGKFPKCLSENILIRWNRL